MRIIEWGVQCRIRREGGTVKKWTGTQFETYGSRRKLKGYRYDDVNVNVKSKVT